MLDAYIRGMEPESRDKRAADLRASDADRERVVDVLREAAAVGRLTVEEHSQRMERAYECKTLGELSLLTTDLPDAETGEPARPVPLAQPENLFAVFSSESRKGRWVVPERMRAVSVFGDCHIDMREAMLRQDMTTIDCVAAFGAVTVLVPDGVRVSMSGPVVCGSKSVRGSEPTDPRAPVLNVNCSVYFGDVTVKRPVTRKRIFGR